MKGRWFVAAALTVQIALSALLVVGGRLHVDEGAYLYAARAVMDGQVLYRDLFFIQPPVAPYLYGLASLVLGEGLVAGRITSVLFGLAATALAIWLARRLGGGGPAGAIAAGLIACNSFQVYFFTITRPYSLIALWFTLACLALTLRRGDGRAGEILAGALLGLTVATRLTALTALPALGLYLWLRHRNRWGRILAPLAAALTVAGAIYLPHYLASPEHFYFNILGMNLSLHSRDLVANLTAKAKATSHLARRYFLLWLLMTFVAFFHRPRWSEWLRSRLKKPDPAFGILLITGAVFGGHHLAKIYQESYQTFLIPVLAALVAAGVAGIARGLERPSLRTLLGGVLVVSCILTLLAQGRSDLSAPGGVLPVQLLRQQAATVARVCPPGSAIFSADSALIAVEADRDVLDGMAASDYFPGWSEELCRSRHVTNDAVLLDYIRTRRAPALVLGDRSYTLSLPLLEPVPEERRQVLLDAVEENYELVEVVPNLFIPDTRTWIYAARDPEGP